MEQINIVQFSPSQHGHLIPAIVQMHIDCIEFDGALLRFHPPFTAEKRQKMESFWNERFSQISTGRRITLLALVSPDGKEEGDVAGIVELGMPDADTGPFRGDVELLMVSPNFRRRGLANKLIKELEDIAREKKRTLLVSAEMPMPNIDGLRVRLLSIAESYMCAATRNGRWLHG
ncbi:hypothetical protein TARUN_1276 [Trichoderma arundinaceum]|uniref:N-acetyltransferase domain-containing protein n=1 Tax=Trichoderma arundinaceum TaxID=490622 RepID=A0A395NXU9_TRIAR|nr:hypothetical protein TARUN_1276 [Trichoderma arundinaceum]